MKYTKLAVVRKRQISDQASELLVKREKIQFLPGDCMLLYGPNNIIRPYFIASGIQEPNLRFIISNKESSDMVSYIDTLKYGDMIRTERVPKRLMPDLIKADNMVFIVESYGISPILSYLSTYPDKRGINILYQGNVNIEWLKARHNVVSNINDITVTKKTNIYAFCSQDLINTVYSNPRVKAQRVHSYIIEG